MSGKGRIAPPIYGTAPNALFLGGKNAQATSHDRTWGLIH